MGASGGGAETVAEAKEVPVRTRPGGRTESVTKRVLEATEHILTEQGYPALSFQGVAKRAGVSRTTMYRRWPSPAELAFDAITAFAAENFETPDTGNLVADLTALLDRIGYFAGSPLGLAAVAASLDLQAAGQPLQRELRQRFWQTRLRDLSPVIERAQERGELPADLDAEAALNMLAGAVYLRVFISGRAADSQWIQRVIAVFTTSTAKEGMAVE